MTPRNKKAMFWFSFFVVLMFTIPPLLKNHAQGQTPPPITACTNNGGVNCLAIDPDGRSVCNDGSVEDIPVFLITECQDDIRNLVKQQADFMADSLCIPPSEISCTTEQSYNALYKKLSSQGLANSELGKQDLDRCRQEINGYKRKEGDYKACLAKNNESDFQLYGTFALPIMKAIFCPLFHGPNSFYDHVVNMCSCDDGYFIYNDQCVNATTICKDKYGQTAYAKNGNCLIPGNSPTPSPAYSPQNRQTFLPPLSPVIIPRPSATPAINVESDPTLISTPDISPSQTPLNKDDVSETPKTRDNIFKSIFNAFVSSIKSLFGIF